MGGGQVDSVPSERDLIQAAVARFPATFGLKAFPGEVFHIREAQSFLDGQGRVMLYLYTSKGQAFCKGTEAELRKALG
jgi:hypothetical protein